MIQANRETGVAAVEMALMLPILLLLVLGIVDFGLLMYQQQIVTNASREGARQGIVMATPRPTAGDITTVVNAYLTAAGLAPGSGSVTITGAGGASGTNLSVSLVYPYQFIVLDNFVPGLPGTQNLNGNSTMGLE
ncbi:MAG: TadE/TadG family type IV pilus assembly protein [Nitrospirae bacterium]|nr:TadE/TadG family type IV pilus assembly protein [Nitrospirota bacterium]